ncbi:MAG: hypothetical protein AAGI23_21690 [Bacteroidota bacterium]
MRFLFLFLSFSLCLWSCDVDQTQEAEMPEVDVDVTEGQMPKYDVNWADVDVRTTTKTVEVPKLVVVMEEEEIEVPVIDFDMPNSGEKVERNIVVETEVQGQAADINIQEIYAVDNNLYVISTLNYMDKDIKDQKMRVSDQVVINASEDLNVKHYIVGEKPSRDFNGRYTYVNSRSDIENRLNNGKVIYRVNS